MNKYFAEQVLRIDCAMAEMATQIAGIKKTVAEYSQSLSIAPATRLTTTEIVRMIERNTDLYKENLKLRNELEKIHSFLTSRSQDKALIYDSDVCLLRQQIREALKS